MNFSALRIILPLACLALALLGWHFNPNPASNHGDTLKVQPAFEPRHPAAGIHSSTPRNLGNGHPKNGTKVAREISKSSDFQPFEDWRKNYLNTPAPQRTALVAKGVRLAEERREVLSDLMKKSPDEALAHSLSWSSWLSLPEEVRESSEQLFSARGNYSVRSDCRPVEERGAPFHLTHLTIGNEVTKVHVTRDWVDSVSKDNIPVQGIRIGRDAVLRPGVLQLLGEADARALASHFPNRVNSAGSTQADEDTVALVGGKRALFRNPEIAKQAANELQQGLQLPGPDSLEAGLAVAFAEGNENPDAVLEAISAASLEWRATPKATLIIRFDFSDIPGGTGSVADLEQRLDEISDLVEDMSFGKTKLFPRTVTSETLRLPLTAAEYDQMSGAHVQIANAAITAANAAGYVTDDYDLISFNYPRTSKVGGGFANLGSGWSWMNGTSSAAVYTHEFGHNYGLAHANFWVRHQAGGDWSERVGIDPRYGAAGNDEYGDNFDIMAVHARLRPGSDSVWPNGHFSMTSKHHLGWLENENVANATCSGIYRIHRFDHPDAHDGNNDLALSFVTADGQRIWAGLRRNFPNNPLLSTSAYVVWANRPNGGRQIDCTPFSLVGGIPGSGYNHADFDRDDGGLPVGASWIAPDGSVRLTNLGLGGTAPEEFLDLQVEILASSPPLGLYTDAGLTTPGLLGSYFNSSLRSTDEPDWRATQTVSGVRVDESLNFSSNSWGVRADVGLTAGTDENWDFFSAQWDGVVHVADGTQLARLATRSDDASRMWIDADGSGTFEAGELLDNGWGSGQGATTGPFSAALGAGTYAIRIQYDEGNGGNTMVLQTQFEGTGDFEIFQDSAAETYGLNSVFVNQSLRGVTSHDDWNSSQTISGSRADQMPLYWDNGMGPRDGTGITGGSDGNWQNFSVQYDGWIKVLRKTRFLTFGVDGSRFWIDTDGDNNFGTTPAEFSPGNWGEDGGQRHSPFSEWIDPGFYRLRIQHEVDSGGNRFAFMGQPEDTFAQGDALVLDGTAHLTAPAASEISGSFTVEAWVKPGSVNTETIFSTRTAGQDYGFTMKMSESEVIAHIGSSSAWLDTNASTTYPFQVGDWVHLAYVVTPTGYTIYIDGWKAGTASFAGTPLLCGPNHPITIGKDGALGQNFSGAIDELRIWNTARSPEEIATSYRRTLPTGTPGLASCWRFDESAGATATDLQRLRDAVATGSISFESMATPVNPAVTLKVTSLLASGPGSLAEAVATANTLQNSEVLIKIEVEGTLERPSGGSLPPIETEITILGGGTDRTSISGMDSDGARGGVFRILSGGNLTVRDITIEGAGDGTLFSSAFHNSGALTIEDCVIRDCYGEGTTSGAVHTSLGALTIRRSLFINNRTEASVGQAVGAAIVVESLQPVVIEDCEFVANITRGPLARGGAIYLGASDVSIERCAFKDNQALVSSVGSSSGGAIYNDTKRGLRTRHNSFHGNTASVPGTEDCNEPILGAGGRSHFDFDEIDGLDLHGDSLGELTLQLVGAPAPAVSVSPQGGVLEFSAPGGGFVELVKDTTPADSVGGLGMNEDFTLAARVRPDDLGGQRPVFGTSEGLTPNGLFAGLDGGFPTIQMSGLTLTGSSPVLPSEWVHLAISYDAQGGQLSLYVDGVHVTSATGVPSQLASSNLLLGMSSQSGVAGFIGGIDDIHIFQQALGAVQIRALAAGQAVPVTGYLPIDANPAGGWTVIEASEPGTFVSTMAASESLLAERANGSIPGFNTISFDFADPQTSQAPITQRFSGWSELSSNTVGDDNDFAVGATIILRIAEEGDYTFGFTGDDGMRLRIKGALFRSSTRSSIGNAANPAHRGDTLTYPNVTGNAETLGVAHLLPGDYEVEFLWFERGGGAWAEVFAASGAKTSFDNDFELLRSYNFDTGFPSPPNVGPSGNRVSISWNNKPGWILESSINLGTDSWVQEPFAVSPDGTVQVLQDSDANSKFFRLSRP